MEEKMENEMETAIYTYMHIHIYIGLCRDYRGYSLNS